MSRERRQQKTISTLLVSSSSSSSSESIIMTIMMMMLMILDEYLHTIEMIVRVMIMKVIDFSCDDDECNRL